ncbi:MULTISPECIES: helical backbone metal receptor [unclassified Micromonospora]|uniref:helical backbone metal receptor n=1 Tax=unclassified Micromonospora TaxID=2617518 RepID=UPI001C21B390|nr:MULTISPECIES: helical backbone metal receptor [unclassified Micromonospora]MBU8861176.1 ABC transporter substrate-binding protein [Micromonospora sp. WMMB482]MDM4780726.1 helical backbone metal receptor [Micromonospora sp. b486]
MRVVSLVPSLTEAVAATRPEVLVGATDWCTHPAGLDVARVGGTKYPDLDRVLALEPDLVLLNEEENRLADAEALRAAGVPVRVTFPRTVPEALDQLGELVEALGAPAVPSWLREARRAWAALPAPERVRTAVVPVWRRPWVVLGRDTFAGDVLARLGVRNGYAGDAERYPRPSLDELRARAPDLVVLPDEPYRFTADDGPEAFPGVPAALVSGRHLTWYGPSLAEAPALLAAQLATAGPT